MKGGFRKLSSFNLIRKGKAPPANANSAGNDKESKTATQKFQKSFSITKTMIKKKMGSISQQDAIPAEFDEYRANAKILCNLFEELAKTAGQMEAAVQEEKSAGKHIALTLTGFATHLSNTEASRTLGELIIEYCKIQAAVEDERITTLGPVFRTIKSMCESYINSLQELKQLADQVYKLHTVLLSSVDDLVQLIGEENFERSLSLDPLQIEISTDSVDEKIDHMALYRAYLSYHRAHRKYHTKLSAATEAFENSFIEKELQTTTHVQNIYEAQKNFFFSSFSEFQFLEEQYHIQEAFEKSKEIQVENEKKKVERDSRDKLRLESQKWVSLLEFYISLGENILCLIDDQNEEAHLQWIMQGFIAHDMAVPWLKKAITAEIERTTGSSTLLRGNTFITKLLMAFMHVNCGVVLFLPLRELVLTSMERKEVYEVDPKKLPEGIDVEDNISGLIEMTNRFIDAIVGCIPLLPSPLRVILAHLREETDRKFPGKGTTFSGALLFLRFLCPAIVFPAQKGIIDSDYQVSKEERRCLMLISKVLQNVANGVRFREDYMSTMNGFVTDTVPVIQDFFTQISQVPDTNEVSEALFLPQDVNCDQLPKLHTYLCENMQMIAQKLDEKGKKEQIFEFVATLGKLSVQPNSIAEKQ